MTKPVISFQQYGKENVRLVKVIKKSDGTDEFVELKVSILLSGKAFEDSYTQADNSNVVATDTMKNIVYVVANQSTKLPCIEKFAIELCEFMIKQYPSLVEKVQITIEKVSWERLTIQGKPQAHAFGGNGNGSLRCRAIACRGSKPTIMVLSEIRELSVLKTTGSSFKNFHRDQYRTLPDADDRILSTNICVRWTYAPIHSFEEAYSKIEFCKAYDIVKDISLYEFACVDSPSVQATLYDTCKRTLDKLPRVEHVYMELPNRHVFTLDLPIYKTDVMRSTPPKDMYIPLAQPNGLIKASVSRSTAAKL